MESDDSEEEDVIILTADTSNGFQKRYILMSMKEVYKNAKT